MKSSAPPIPRFSPNTLSFLRALKRHNDRGWFADHREEYEREVKARMTAFVDRVGHDLVAFAPDLVASPRVSLYRIYRDTRFSEDKSPFKTQVGAVFPHRDLERHRGAGLYVEIGPAGTMIAGGMYAPEPAELQAVREHIASHFRRFRALAESAAFLRAVGPVEGDSLKRVPRGFPADHPAAQYLKLRQYLFGRSFPSAEAVTPRFYARVIRLFREMAPLVHFLNEPLVGRLRERDPLHDDGGH